MLPIPVCGSQPVVSPGLGPSWRSAGGHVSLCRKRAGRSLACRGNAIRCSFRIMRGGCCRIVDRQGL